MNLYYPFYLVLHLFFLIIDNLSQFYHIIKENVIEQIYFKNEKSQKEMIENSLELFNKLPTHLGIALGYTKEKLNHKNLSLLIIWSCISQIPLMTIMDSKEDQIDLTEIAKNIINRKKPFLNLSKFKTIQIENSDTVLVLDLMQNNFEIKKNNKKENREFNPTEIEIQSIFFIFLFLFYLFFIYFYYFYYFYFNFHFFLFLDEINKLETVKVKIISQKESRIDFFEMIKNCGEFKKENKDKYFNINENVIRSNLVGVDPNYPDPQLILTFNTNMTTSGFLPYHVYSSEIL